MKRGLRKSVEGRRSVSNLIRQGVAAGAAAEQLGEGEVIEQPLFLGVDLAPDGE
jgi:hypothetical protein